MVEKFTGYKASNGKSFDNECEAWGEELSILIAALADNDAITRKVVAGIITNPHDIADVLAHLTLMTPRVAITNEMCGSAAALVDEIQADALLSECGRIGTNSGHGHAWDRPDGVKARCGGTKLGCTICAHDKAVSDACDGRAPSCN